MRFGIVSDIYKDADFAMLKQTAEILENLGQEVCFPSTRDKNRNATFNLPSHSWDGVDLAISIGGDGTFLYTCHEVYGLDIPMIGVNLGRMGFMTEIEQDELREGLERVAKKDFSISHRMMLEIFVRGESGEERLHTFALNDAVLYRGSISRIIPCTFGLNGNMIETIPSDGLIVASPTGSTGYALACGGPIIHPQLELMLFTPICPHTLHNRSYIIAPNNVIQIGIEEDYPFRPMFTIDGRSVIDIGPKDTIEVKKAEQPMKIISLDSYEFFHRLPDKINARGRVK